MRTMCLLKRGSSGWRTSLYSVDKISSDAFTHTFGYHSIQKGIQFNGVAARDEGESSFNAFD